MFDFKKVSADKILRIALYFVATMSLFFGIQYTTIKLEKLEVFNQDQRIVNQDPYFFSVYDRGEVVFKANIDNTGVKQNIYNLVIDDCLETLIINDQQYTPQNLNKDKICNVQKGVELPIGDLLNEGQNRLEFRTRNYGGEANLQITNSFSDPLYLALVSFLIFFLSLFLYEIFTLFGLKQTLSILLSFGVLIRLIYLSYTNFQTRQHDALGETGHIGYVKYILENFALPDPNNGFEFHQAPLYYIFSTLWIKMGEFFGFSNLWNFLQLQSILFFTVFLFFTLLIFQKFITSKHNLFLVSALLIFWPSTILHSVRITNDQLVFAMFGGLLYFLLSWYQSLKLKHFIIAFIFFIFGMMTKSTMVLGVLIIFLVFIIKAYQLSLSHFNYKQFWSKQGFKKFKYISEKAKKYKFTIFKYFGISFVLSLVGFIVNFDLIRIFNENNLENVIGSSQLSNKLKVGSGLQNYLYFDIEKFLTVPFMSPWEDSSGRQYFWNFFLKTSLFGEWTFFPDQIQNLAVAISFSFFVILLTVVGFLVLSKKSLWQVCLFWILLVFVFGNMAHRYSNTYAPNSDFRFVLPILVPFLLILNEALIWLKTFSQKNIYRLTVFCIYSFLFFTIIFISLPLFLD
jgi:hypothetical protein